MKTENVFIRMLGYLFLLLVVFYIVANALLYLSSFNASHQLSENLNQEFLRIKIYGSSTSAEGNTVSGTFSIIDTNGNEIAVIERSWSGAYLAVEFAQINLNGRYFVFVKQLDMFVSNRLVC